MSCDKETVLVWLFWVALCLAANSPPASAEAISPGTGGVERKTFFVADTPGTPEDEKAAGSPADEKSEPKTEVGKGGAPSSTETAPLKPFVPSEQVEADQAVDFPYDI